MHPLLFRHHPSSHHSLSLPQKLVRKSAFLASSVVANFVQPRVEEVAASGKRVRHKALGQEIEVRGGEGTRRGEARAASRKVEWLSRQADSALTATRTLTMY